MFLKSFCPIRAPRVVGSAPSGSDIVSGGRFITSQWVKCPEAASGSSTTRTSAFVPCGGEPPGQLRGEVPSVARVVDRDLEIARDRLAGHRDRRRGSAGARRRGLRPGRWRKHAASAGERGERKKRSGERRGRGSLHRRRVSRAGRGRSGTPRGSSTACRSRRSNVAAPKRFQADASADAAAVLEDATRWRGRRSSRERREESRSRSRKR